MNNDLICCRGDMLQQYYLKRFHAADRKRTRRIFRIQNRIDAEAYITEVRKKLKQCFGPLPPTTVINPQITGKVETPKLLIEKILFASRPGFYVPALFYRPKQFSGQLPGILHLCGHTGIGKLGKTYQEVCQSLALRGFGVLCPDPFGQGERREFGNGPGNEHDSFGLSLGLSGNFFGVWRLHDALTALEYLKSREEIDGTKIGVTGCSGGGTLTSYVNAFSDIPMMVAPVCSITRMTRNLENELYTDCEQMPPHFKELGLEETDLFLVRAPRPCYLGIQDNDFFDPAATMEVGAEIRRFYRYFKAESKVVVKTGEGDHGYPVYHRIEVGKFFSSLVKSQPVGTDSDIVVFPEEQLYCTPGGNVKNLKSARLARDILQELSVSLPQKLNLPGLKHLLGIGRITAPTYRNGFQQYFDPAPLHASRFLLQSEPGIEIALKKISSEISNKPDVAPETTLLLPEKAGLSEFRQLLPESDTRETWLLEVRGVGETLSCPPDIDLITIYPRLYAASGTVLGKPFLGGQVLDLLNCLHWMKSQGAQKIHIRSARSMSIPALLASIWSPLPLELTLTGLPESWRDFMRNPDLTRPYSEFPFGILKYGDLPQLMSAARNAGHEITSL